MKKLMYKDIKELDYFYIEQNGNRANFMKKRNSQDYICMDSKIPGYWKTKVDDFPPEKIVKQD